MKHPFLYGLAPAMAVSLIGAGCPTSRTQVIQRPVEPVMQKPAVNPDSAPMKKEDGQSSAPVQGEVAMKTGSYAPFNKAAYDTFLASHTPVLLFFYASWCPYCKAQDPIMRNVFQDGTAGLNALRVNYQDSDTDADEKALADTFGISSQHSFVLLAADGTVITKKVGPQTEEQLRELIRMVR